MCNQNCKGGRAEIAILDEGIGIKNSLKKNTVHNIDYDIEPLCDYRAWNEETRHGANEVVFHAIIKKIVNIPESEVAEIKDFTVLPDNLTYPTITPVLFEYLFKTEK